MLKVPFYTFASYSPMLSQPFKSTDSNWIDFGLIINLMNSEYVNKYSSVDATKLGEYIRNNSATLKTPVSIGGDNFKRGDELLTAIKLLLPTLWTCNYFFWNVNKGTHHGIDIILPKGTPLPAFADGEIFRIKKWDGVTKNEGNCVVIKSNLIVDGNVFICYEHMDSINVNLGQKVKAGETIGYCGTTGNSTQYHLHLQFDKANAAFHPFYSKAKDTAEIQKFTYDPIMILRKIYGSKVETKPTDNLNKNENITITTNELFLDMPSEENYKSAIKTLFNSGIIKGSGGYIYPAKTLKRYEFILILHRIITKYNLFKDKYFLEVTKKFNDVDYNDTEFVQALSYMMNYGMVNISADNFNPLNEISGEEVLAFMGRVFYSLNDKSEGNWYQNYLDKFVELGIIDENFEFISKPIFRQNLFEFIFKLLKKNNLLF